MKIGILTFHAAHNYGAMLQAYATQTVLEKLGHEPEFINYYSLHAEKNNHKCKWNGSPRQLLKNLFYAKHMAQWSRQHERYEAFKCLHLRMGRRYTTPEALRRTPPEYDIYLTGSDQVWNMERGINAVWLLDFIEEGHKVAYAPSFGTGEINEAAVDTFGAYLPSYCALSCREKRGVEMIQEMTGLNADYVLDPTMLLTAEDWQRISSDRIIDEPYICVYCTEETELFMNMVVSLSRATQLPVAIITSSAINRFRYAKWVVRDAGPSEFLSLMAGAEIICTNSFHGTVFALIFEKQFVSIAHETRNERIKNLLEIAGLCGRQICSDGIIRDISAVLDPIDYPEVRRRLRKEIERSLAFLGRALRQDNTL